MGGTKRELERHEAASDWARGKLLEHGYLTRCEIHDEILDSLMGSSSDIGEVLSELRLKKEYWPDVIRTRDELVDALKDALDNSAADCWQCEKQKAE